MTLKEVIDKPRIYHQLVPMEVQYEYGTIKVIIVYRNTIKDNTYLTNGFFHYLTIRVLFFSLLYKNLKILVIRYLD